MEILECLSKSFETNFAQPPNYTRIIRYPSYLKPFFQEFDVNGIVKEHLLALCQSKESEFKLEDACWPEEYFD